MTELEGTKEERGPRVYVSELGADPSSCPVLVSMEQEEQATMETITTSRRPEREREKGSREREREGKRQREHLMLLESPPKYTQHSASSCSCFVIQCLSVHLIDAGLK